MICRSQATATFNFRRQEKRAISCSVQSSSSTIANARAFELFSKTVGSTSEQATPGSGQFRGSPLRDSGPVNQISDLTGQLALFLWTLGRQGSALLGRVSNLNARILLDQSQAMCHEGWESFPVISYALQDNFRVSPKHGESQVYVQFFLY